MDVTSYKYGRALLPAKYNICGVELKPFCLGHLILLEETYNPLASPIEENIEMQEAIFWLFQGILICSMSFEDNLKVLNDDNLYSELTKEFNSNLTANMKLDKDWNFLSKLNLFKEYLKYYMQMPLYNEENQNNDVPSGTDWKQNIFIIFKKLGYKESEILNMNMKKLFYEWCSYAEAEGAIKVMNKFDVERLEQLKGNK